ncbi:MAG: DUF655 domain-containing protein [Tissierellia bacterium]|nr:DUF655 domain-containing protein [Tissierellia bacterium]
MNNKCVKNYLTIGFLVIAIIIVIIFRHFANNNTNEIKMEIDSSNDMIVENESEPIEESEEDIYIHISGEVKFPGLVKLKNGSRLIDAIDKAGGLSSEVDLDRINLAMVLEDEQKIYIPNKDEEIDEDLVDNESSLININTAGKDRLVLIPGIGDKTAEKIIQYRQEHRFSSIEDIKNVPGIGDKKFDEMKNYIRY